MSLDSRRDADLLTALSDLGQPNPGERSDDDLIAGALAGVADPRLAPLAPPDAEVVDLRREEQRSNAPVVIAVAAAAVAIAAAVVLVVLRPAGLLGNADDPRGSLAQSIHDDDDDGAHATERTPAAEGGHRATHRERREPAEPEAVDADDAQPEDEDAVVVEDDTGGALVEEIADDATGGVETGGVERRHRRAKKPASPDTMLARAQTQLGAGKTTQAVRTYESLIARYPRSASAKAARVSLGRIELSRGNAKKALGYFDAYLSMSAGALVQEARYGRIRALRKLGRTDAERRSIEAFLADYPKSVYTPRLDKRAAELASP